MFDYSDTQLDALRRLLSEPRLQPYLEQTSQDGRRAIKLYERNSDLSEALYGLLQGLEIAMRNSFHETLSDGFKTSEWYDMLILKHTQSKQLQTAKRALRNERKPLESGRIVAELSFGFWAALANASYEKQIWVARRLWKAFPARKNLDRREVFRRLEKIRVLRNRVAHHENILKRNLERDVADILETIRWICPTTAEWIAETTHFRQCYARRYD
jgi:hypothetical protein